MYLQRFSNVERNYTFTKFKRLYIKKVISLLNTVLLTISNSAILHFESRNIQKDFFILFYSSKYFFVFRQHKQPEKWYFKQNLVRFKTYLRLLLRACQCQARQLLYKYKKYTVLKYITFYFISYKTKYVHEFILFLYNILKKKYN